MEFIKYFLIGLPTILFALTCTAGLVILFVKCTFVALILTVVGFLIMISIAVGEDISDRKRSDKLRDKLIEKIWKS